MAVYLQKQGLPVVGTQEHRHRGNGRRVPVEIKRAIWIDDGKPYKGAVHGREVYRAFRRREKRKAEVLKGIERALNGMGYVRAA